MIQFENYEVVGIDHAARGMRNPMNSWENSDSTYVLEQNNPILDYFVGEKDIKLMETLCSSGSDHRKFMRMITVYVDITAPLYWWKQTDQYKIGVTTNSTSTMHKVQDKEFTINDFSHEHLLGQTEPLWVNADRSEYKCSAMDFCQITCDVLNFYRNKFLETKEKKYWLQMIQLLPSSYNQRRTVALNYEVLLNMYHARKNHKLDEWKDFCKWCETLSLSELITGRGE